MHSTLHVVHTHTFSRSCRLQLSAAVLVMVDESPQRVAVLVVEEALQDLHGSNMVCRSGELLLPCLPSGVLAWRAAWVSTRKWGLAFSLPFSSASVFAAFKTPSCSTGLFSALSSLSRLLLELPLLLLVLLLLLPLLRLLLLALPNGDGGSSGTSRCVERGARRGCEAIRAGSALMCCTSSGASSSSSATILFAFPFGSFFFGFASSFRSSRFSSFLPSGLPLLLSSALCFFFSLFSFLCFLSPCRTQRTRKTQSMSPGTVRGTTRATRKTHRTVQTGSRDRYKDNTTDVRNMQNMYLFGFIGDKTPGRSSTDLVHAHGHGGLPRSTGGREEVL